MADQLIKIQQRPAESIKAVVREAYTTRIQGSTSCCAGTPEAPCCGDSVAGPGSEYYSLEERQAGGAAANSSFGCGNPFAIAGLQAGETVVDLGSGAGFDSFLAARQVGIAGRVIGIDFTPAMLEKARANAATLGLSNVEFVEGDIEALPLPTGSADVVISNCVINLAPDKLQVFREALRILKPDGRLAVSDITLLKPLPPQLAADPVVYAGCIGGAILETEYLAAMRNAGFVDIEVLERVPYSDGNSCCSPTSANDDLVANSIRVAARKPA